MADGRDGDHVGPDQDNEREEPQRRPWHAPQFMLTDIALTDAQGNPPTDGIAAQLS